MIRRRLSRCFSYLLKNGTEAMGGVNETDRPQKPCFIMNVPKEKR